MATAAWKAALVPELDPCNDEAYYFYWSLHPQLSYFDHPPLTAWAIWLSRLALGEGIWAIRIWPLLVGLCFPILGYKLADRMFGAAVGARVGLFLALCPAFSGNGFVMTPDTLYALCWAGALAATWQAVTTKRLGWWCGAGLCVGLGLLAKYNMVLYFLSLALFWMLAPAQRRTVFFGIVVTGVIGFLFFVPVLWWNVAHQWVSFRFQLAHGFVAQRDPLAQRLAEYAGGLLLTGTPVLGVMAFISSARAIRSAEPARRLLSAFFWGTIVLFLLSAMRTRVGPNWPMLSYFAGFALVAADWPRYHPLLRRTALGLLAALSLLMLGGATYIALPNTALLRIARKPLNIPRMEEFRGGADLARAVCRRLKENNLDFVSVRRHQLFGELAFFAPEIRDRLWLSKQGLIRFPWLDARRWRGANALLIMPTKDPDYLPLRRHPSFDKLEHLDECVITVKGVPKRTLVFYAGTGYRP